MNIQPPGKVTVCIPTYNGARYLGEAIESVLSQTYPHFELAVIDNASEDETESLVEEYRRRDARIRYHRYSSHVGLFENFNRCFDHVTGDYVKFLCSDDVLMPAQMEKQVAVLDSNPNVALVACAKRIINARGDRIADAIPFASERTIPGGLAIRASLETCRNFFGEPLAILFRAETLRRVGPYDPACGHAADWEHACRILGTGDLHYQSEVLCELRVHEGQFTHSLRRSREINRRILCVYSRVLSDVATFGPFTATEKHRALIKILTSTVVSVFARRESPATLPSAFALVIRHAPLYPFVLLFLAARVVWAFLLPHTRRPAEFHETVRQDVERLRAEQYTGDHMLDHLRRVSSLC